MSGLAKKGEEGIGIGCRLREYELDVAGEMRESSGGGESIGVDMGGCG